VDIKVDNLDFNHLRLIDENGQLVEFNLHEELKVNEPNLLQEMLQQPSKYIYWSSLLEKLKYFQEATELELELETARLEPEARTKLKEDTPKPTKDQVEAYIKRQPSYQAQRKSLQHFEYIVGRVARIVKAFEQRKDMLQSYGKQVAEQKLYGGGAGSTIEDVHPNPFGQ
jgi:hypothetical protein